MLEVVQVRYGFSHGEHHLMCIQLAREKDAEKFPRAAWPGTGGKQFRTTGVVVLDELVDAQADVAKWTSV